jgi:GGDEF domain-containing protein
LVVLPDIDGNEAVFAANRLRKTVSDEPILLADGDIVSVTVSVGKAVASPEWTSVAHRISQAGAQFGKPDAGDWRRRTGRSLTPRPPGETASPSVRAPLQPPE